MGHLEQTAAASAVISRLRANRWVRGIGRNYRFQPAAEELRRILSAHLNRERRVVAVWPRPMTKIYALLTPARRQYPLPSLIVLSVVGSLPDVVTWMKLRDPKYDGWGWRSISCGVDSGLWCRFGPNGHFDSIPALMLWPLTVEVVHNQNDRSPRSQISTLSGAVVPIIADGLLRRTQLPLRSWRWLILGGGFAGALRVYSRRRFRLVDAEMSKHLLAIQAAAESLGELRARQRVVGSGSTRDVIDKHRLEVQALPEAVEVTKRIDSLRDRHQRIAHLRSGQENDLHYFSELLELWERVVRVGRRFVDGTWPEPLVRPTSLAGVKGPRLEFSQETQREIGSLLLTSTQMNHLDRIFAERTGLTTVPAITNLDFTRAADPNSDEPYRINCRVLKRQRIDLPGAPLIVQFNVVDHAEFEIEIPGSETIVREEQDPYDPSPLGHALSGFWSLNDLTRWRAGTPLYSSVGPLFTFGTAFAAQRSQRTNDPWSPKRTCWAAVLCQLVGTLAADVSYTPVVKSDGTRLVAPIQRAQVPLLFVSWYWSRLSRHERNALLAAIATVATIGTVRSRGRWSWFDVAMEAWFACQAIPPALRRDTSSLHLLESDLVRIAADHGTSLALEAELTHSEALLEESGQLYADVRSLIKLSEGEQQQVEHFLEDCRAGLTELQHPAELPSDGFEALSKVRATTVVVDIENTLLKYGSSPEERRDAIDHAIAIAEANNVRRLFFVTNSNQFTLEQVNGDTGRVAVTMISAARKPWIELSPLKQHRTAMQGATVIGDHPLTDGQLARRLGGRFVQVRGFYEDGDREPIWPTVLRWIGDLLQPVDTAGRRSPT